MAGSLTRDSKASKSQLASLLCMLPGTCDAACSCLLPDISSMSNLVISLMLLPQQVRPSCMRVHRSR